MNMQKAKNPSPKNALRAKGLCVICVRFFAGCLLQIKESAADELRFILRQRSVLLILAGIPLFYPVVISSLYNAKQAVERPCVVIDEDNSSLSRKFVSYLDATQEVAVKRRAGSFDQGWSDLKQRRAELLLYFPPDFSRRIKKGEQGIARLWINAANMTTYAMSYPALSRVTLAVNEELSKTFFYAKGMGTTMSENRIMPIDQDIRYLFHPTLSYGGFLVTGIFPVILQQLILISLSLSAGLRRELGEYDEGHPRPLSRLAGMAAAHGIYYVLGIGVILAGIFPAFGWSLASGLSMFMIFLIFMIAMAPLAMIVAHFSNDRYASFQILMMVSTPLFMFSGFIMPPDQMPKYIEVLSWAFPLTPALLAVRILAMKTGSLTYVAPYIAWLAALFVAYSALAFVIVKKGPMSAKSAAAAPTAELKPVEAGHREGVL